ncbi:MAG: hypothetical protein MUF64_03860, partial [Polyangiaceae bacterium]|nr:hypothetical protein [Polyangiaceae bacterium]
MIDALGVAHLLRRHVQRRAQGGLGARQAVLHVLCPQELRDPEVEDLQRRRRPGLLDQEQVGGLEVAVHDPPAVGLGQRIAGLEQQPRHLAQRHGAALLQVRVEVPTLEQLHGEVRGAPRGVIEIKEAHRVGAAQHRRRPALPEKSTHRLGVLRGIAVQHLQRHLVPLRQVPRRDHHPHPAATQ